MGLVSHYYYYHLQILQSMPCGFYLFSFWSSILIFSSCLLHACGTLFLFLVSLPPEVGFFNVLTGHRTFRNPWNISGHYSLVYGKMIKNRKEKVSKYKYIFNKKYLNFTFHNNWYRKNITFYKDFSFILEVRGSPLWFIT